MCGILVHNGNGNIARIQRRGQDYTNSIKIEDFIFSHCLLSITGEFTPQPYIDGNIVCVYNGEIYNHSYSKSDGEVIIPLYKKYGEHFAKHLDGEFAIALYDFDRRQAIFCKDAFGTKPLFVNGLYCASYRSGVGGEKLPPNTVRIANFDGKTKELPIVNWDLTQYNDSYDNWISAFENSIRKRSVKNCFIGLSSGYDSGAIACEMLKQRIPFKTFTYMGSENVDIVNRRISLIGKDNSVMFNPDRSILPFLRDYIDDEPYTIKYKSGRKFSVLTEGGTLGVATFSKLANEMGLRVALSSQGADEIMSDYAYFSDQSELLGKFPNELKLWNNFNYGCQESYLMKEEYAGGAFNIETRYPFLDKQLVQEFLWLHPNLKNSHYKAPLREYLIRNNFPFDENRKVGFTVNI